MLPLDLLRVAFTRLVLIYLYMARVGAPRVRVIFCDPKGFQQGFELQKYFVLATPKHIGQDLATAVMLGRRKARYLAARFLTPPV